MKTKRFHLIVGILILFSNISCEDSSSIPDYARPVWDDGHIVVFLNSNINEFDSLIINKEYRWETSDNYHEEYCYLHYKYPMADTAKFTIKIQIEKALVYDNSVDIPDYLFYFDQGKTYNQSGYVYDDVYKLRFDTIQEYYGTIYHHNPELREVWYSLKHGIIRYTTKDGEDFNLIRN
ncbi:MAG: hypothetical protein PF590_09375 [Candidatus Delongbacteria bacterium]|nr:hypothetical protein [Candidatus Delongbacteria bacterium]